MLTRLLVAAAIATPAFGQGYLCAEGGGNEQNGNWAPAVFGWMVEKGGFGDVVILGVSGADQQVAQTFLDLGAASATNVAVNVANADDQATYDAIVEAEIVWLRGGDQWQYVSQWNGTLAEEAIRDVYEGGGVVGGTSAGLHVLSEIVYDASVGSLSPRQALRDPHHPFLTLTDDFLALLPGTLLDSHFTERGRLGRLLVMLARHHEDTGEDILAIGVDDRTALCVHPDLTAEVRGEGAVTFLHRTDASTQVIEPGEAPVVTALRHDQLTEGYWYDIASRTVFARPDEAVIVDPPQGEADFHELLLSGDSLQDKVLGEVEWLDFNDDLALFYGSMEVVPGQGLLAGAVLSARVWNSATWDENRVGGPQYATHLNPHLVTIYLDGGTQAQASQPALLEVLEPAGPESSVVILDAHGMVSSAQSTYVSSPNSDGPRQSVAIEGATLHALRHDWTYDALAHEAIGPCPGDFDGDGQLTILDFVAFQNAFTSGDPAADCDGSGALNILDFVCYQNLFQAGCP